MATGVSSTSKAAGNKRRSGGNPRVIITWMATGVSSVRLDGGLSALPSMTSPMA